MSAWTRYKYERTRLPENLILLNKPESQLKAEQKARERRGETSNDPDTMTTATKPENSNNTIIRRPRREMTEQMRQIERARKQENGLNDNLDENDSENDEKNEKNSKKDKNENENENDTKTKTILKTKKKAQTAKNKSKLPAWALRHSTGVVECPNCRNGGSPQNDPKAGRIVCTECGLVLQVGFISEQSEWRNFADGDKSGPDPNRVGSAGHYLLNDVDDLSTKIADGSYLQNLQQSTTNSNVSQKLLGAIKQFERNGRELGLSKDAQNCAGEIFKDFLDCEELRSKKMKSKQAMAMYFASKMCDTPRPFREICAKFGVDKSAVRKLHSEVSKLMASKKLNIAKHRKQNERMLGRRSIHDKKQSTIEVYALRYASHLQCDKKKINKMIKSIVLNVETKFDFSKNRQPTSIAAACVYFACLMIAENEKERRTYKEVSAVSSVSETTLQDIYRRQLYPNRTKLIPSFADQLRAENLPLR